jgi:hypothetical protein
MSAAFTLIFCQGRSPPSCPVPNDTDLLNRIRDKVQNASPAECRDSLIRVQRLSHDVYEIWYTGPGMMHRPWCSHLSKKGIPVLRKKSTVRHLQSG